MMSMPAQRWLRSGAITLLLALLSVPAPAHAHGGAVSLDEWGGFPPAPAYCQRIIANAAARCTLRAARARRDCLDATIRGATCDEMSTNATIQAARREALDLIDLYCNENSAATLGYTGTFDLQADVIRFCREWEDLTAAAVYHPVLDAVPPLDAETLACVRGVAVGVDKLAKLVFRTWRRALDRIAVRTFDLPEKQKRLGVAEQRCSTAETRVADVMTRACGDERFQTIYSKTPDALANQIQLRASCFAPAFYIQNETGCAASVCGNGILEPAEGCDDGNVEDGDGCSSECIAE